MPAKEKYEDLVAAIDVAAPYLYPVPYQPVSSVGDAVARARAASGGKKPVLPILQLFAWTADARYPTPTELRCMTFLALVEGASGIGYYNYATASGKVKSTIAEVEPALWQSVKPLNREVAEVGPRLLAGKISDEVSLVEKADGIRVRAVRDAAGLLVILVNRREERRRLKLAIHTNEKLTVAQDKPLAVNNNAGELALEPFGVAILRSATAR